MLQSMTGFGKATGTFHHKKITVEIKSLNSKNFDLFVRIPNKYKSNEIELRKLLGEKLSRGKVECSINIEDIGDTTGQKINTAKVKSYYNQLSELTQDLSISDENMLAVLMRMPEIYDAPQDEVSEEEWEHIMAAAERAALELIIYRGEEGSKLVDEFSLRIQNIQLAFEQIPQYEKLRIETIKERIENNLEEFVGSAKTDKNRFEQELIYYLEKFDISEEQQRLQNHLSYFLETMNKPESNGKKLGFITQEIGREINTLGSKSYHSEMQKLVVEMKDELEKIKEQVLNTL